MSSESKHLKNPSPITLTDLPNELILEIFTYFSLIRGFSPNGKDDGRRTKNRVGQKALTSLCLTSHRMRDLAEQELYRNFIVGEDEFQKPQSLLRSFIKRPNLRKLLEYIEISGIGQDEVHKKGERIMRWKHIEPMINDISGSTWRPRYRDNSDQFDTWSGLLEDSYGKYVMATIAVSIILAPNLIDLAFTESTFMRFTYGANPGSDFLGLTLAMRKYVSPQPGLRNLWIQYHQTSRQSISQFLFATGFPVSNRIWLGNVKEPMLRECVWHEKFSYRALHGTDEIILNNCDLNLSTLDLILSKRTGLRTFVCRWAAKNDLDYPSQPVSLSSLNASLTRHADTLETIVLNTMRSRWLTQEQFIAPPLGSLCRFTSLKQLEVSGFALFAGQHYSTQNVPLSSLLPPNLEKLIIEAVVDLDLIHRLTMLAKDCGRLLPNLKNVECSWMPAPASPETTEMIEHFESAGVKLILNTADL